LADVAAVAEMEPERVEAFAGPVLAERAHITAAALAAPLRRAGETASVRSLRQIAAERLLAFGLDIDDVEWDAWRRSDGRWIAAGRFTSGDVEHVARFLFDHRNRFSQAENDDARWLIGDGRLTGPGQPAVDQDSEPTVDLPEPTPASASSAASAAPNWLGLLEHASGAGIDHRSALDTLYDMISVIEEDSVKIYRGLREPLSGVESEPLTPPVDAAAQPDPAPLPGPAPLRPAPLSELQPLIELAPEAASSEAAGRRRGGRRHRASVPSWDEIMFGSTPPPA
jgi:hypothetical protein